jgi:hypothetical protein
MDAKRTLREIKLLRHLDHENVINQHRSLALLYMPVTGFSNSGANNCCC